MLLICERRVADSLYLGSSEERLASCCLIIFHVTFLVKSDR
jgi:hypothetical protein